MNPLTPLTAAICAVVVVMVAHEPVVSGIFLIAAAVLGLFAGCRHRRALLAALVISVPATVSYALIYVPFADDGWATTGDLSLRFAAMTVSGLLLLSFVNADDLMRDLQLRIPAPLVYMLGSVVRLLPMAQHRWRTIRQVQLSRGVPDSWRARTSCVLPLVVGLVVDAGNRARPLQRTGIGETGTRTVLVPVADPPVQRIGRWLLIVASVLAAVLAVM